MPRKGYDGMRRTHRQWDKTGTDGPKAERERNSVWEKERCRGASGGNRNNRESPERKRGVKKNEGQKIRKNKTASTGRGGVSCNQPRGRRHGGARKQPRVSVVSFGSVFLLPRFVLSVCLRSFGLISTFFLFSLSLTLSS